MSDPLLDELAREAQQRSRDALIDWVIKVLIPTTLVATATAGVVGSTAGYIVARDVDEKSVLEVTSKPSPARVTLDGRVVGKTPIARLDVDPGTHAIVVESLGFEPWTDNVKVKDGATVKVHADLAKATPTPKPAREVSYTSRAAAVPQRDCQSERYQCESGCRSAQSSCWIGCPGCSSCSDGWENCKPRCDNCRAGCEQNEDFCEASCKTQYEICSR